MQATRMAQPVTPPHFGACVLILFPNVFVDRQDGVSLH